MPPTRRQFVAATAALATSVGAEGQPPPVANAKPDIWGDPLPPQPFDKQPFRPVKIPAWVRDTVGVGYTLSVMSSADRKAAAAMGVTISEVGFVDPFYPYYDSKLLKKRSPHVPLDRTAKDVAEYGKLGVRVLGVYPPTLQSEVWELHPEWRRVPTDTDKIPEVDLKAHPYGGMLCLLGPYGDFVIDVLAEIVTKFPTVAAFSFDGLHHAGGCFCGHCRKAFKGDTGDAIPKRDMDSEAYRKYLHWADRKLEDVVRRMQTKLKGINPDVALVTWTTNAGRFGHLLDIPRNMPARLNLLFDAPDQEFWMDETNRGATVVPAFGAAYVWAVSGHRVAFAEPYLMSRGNPYGKDSFPPHEVERRVLLATTHGAGPSLAIAQPEPLKPAVKAALAAIKARAKWMTHRTPEPWAAVLVSDNTRVFYGREPGKVEERYLASVFGVFRTGLEEHLPLALVNDWDLTAEKLAKFKLLVLPNAAALDDRQAEAVAAFVAGGGGLVATLDTGRCDEFGTPRLKPALSEVLGVKLLGAAVGGKPGEKLDENFARTLPPEYWKQRTGTWDFRRKNTESFLHAERVSALIGKDAVTFKGPVTRVELLPGSRVDGTVQAKGDPKAPELPAVISRTHGRGRVVYLAAGFDAGHYLASYPYYRLILAGAMRHAASAPPPVEVKAPMCVQATVTRQVKDGERLLVHLFNNVNTTAGHGLPSEEVPLREETIPIHDITVTFNGYAVKRVHLEPDGTELKANKTPGGVSVNVQKLDVHAVVVAELS
jgi:hypothetical protein